MADPPPFDETPQQALAALDNEGLHIFYAYFEDLKRQARIHLGRKARTIPGESASNRLHRISTLLQTA